MQDENTSNNIEREKNDARERRVFEAIIIAASTFFGYGIYFRHEAGYLAYFGLPQDMVDITLTGIVGCMSSVAVVIFVIVAVVAFVARIKWLAGRWDSIGFVGWYVYWAAASASMAFAAGKWPAAAFPVVLAAVLFLCFLKRDFITPIRSRREAETPWQAIIRASRERRIVREDASLSSRLSVRFGPLLSVVVVAGGLGLYIAPVFGGMSAAEQVRFGTMPYGGGEVLMIRKYGGQYIFAPFNRKLRLVLPTDVPLTADLIVQRGLSISFENIGPMRLGQIVRQQQTGTAK